jgi:hypothetical protein
LDTLSLVQLQEWEAYDTLDPVGTWRDDFRMAKVESLIVNISNAIHHKKNVTPAITSPIDFMVDWTGEEKPEAKKQSVEEMKEIFVSMAKEHNERVGRMSMLNKRSPKNMIPTKYQGL